MRERERETQTDRQTDNRARAKLLGEVGWRERERGGRAGGEGYPTPLGGGGGGRGGGGGVTREKTPLQGLETVMGRSEGSKTDRQSR